MRSARQVLAYRAALWGYWGEGGGDRLVPSSLSLGLGWWPQVAANIDAESCCGHSLVSSRICTVVIRT